MDNIDLVETSIKMICLVVIGTSLIISGLQMLQTGKRLNEVADQLKKKKA